MAVRTGLERLLAEEFHLVEGKRLGLLMNPTAVTPDLRHGLDALLERGARVEVLFGPEHGIRGEAQDMVAVEASRDEATGLPVRSLYGRDEASLRPGEADLSGLDAVVFDIQDVGSRYYTYAATLVLTMRVAARLGVEIIVLDRPNPIGGRIVEGPVLRPGFESFVGLLPVPVRHGLTVGELARLANESGGLGCRLTVVPCEGWRRGLWYDHTGLPFVMPSPNMPTLDTATVYPGSCLVEATNLSEGRGTTRPFELVGAPFLDARGLAADLNRLGLPGVVYRAVSFTPTFQKHAGRSCRGVQVHVTDRERFPSFLAGAALLSVARARSRGSFSWRVEPYEFVTDRPAIDLLAGNDTLRQMVEAGVPPEDMAASWREEEEEFRRRRVPFLLYPD